MNLWVCQNSAQIDFSRPGNPADNAFLESFSGTFCDECLSAHPFETHAKANRGKNILALVRGSAFDSEW